MAKHLHAYSYSRARSQRALLIAFSMTAAMFVAELFGGIISNSLALIGDAGHMLMDSMALAVGVLAFKLAQRPATARRTYGHYRLEILAALANGILLLIVSFYVFYEAYHRLTSPAEVKAPLMLAVAVVGLAVNVFSLYVLGGVRKENLNVKGAYLHVLSDAISSVGVITAAVIIYFTGAFIVDALMGILIGGIILRSAFGLLSESGKVLLESVPEEIDVENVIKEIKKVKGVRSVHDMHLWSISSGINAMSGHVVIEDQMVSKAEDVLMEITLALRDKFSVAHTTIQLECNICKSPFTCSLVEKERE
ncbi:MAG: cation diffusion facilitator family transporter [Methanobacteriota archaeon]